METIRRSTIPEPEVAAQKVHPGPEAFFIRADGGIAGCSNTAGAWWDLDSSDALIGLKFEELFSVSSQLPDENEEPSGWELLKAGLNEAVPVTARTTAGDVKLSVVLRAVQGLSSEIAFVANVSTDSSIASATGGSLPIGEGRRNHSPQLHEETLAIFDLDLSDNTARFSPAWWAMIGQTEIPKKANPDHLLAILHPDDSEALPRADSAGQPGGFRAFSADARIGTEEGDWLWVQIEGSVEFDRKGRMARLSGIMLDITQRREVEEESLAIEDRFHRLISGGPIAFFEVDLENDSATYSPEFAHSVGYASDALGSSIDAFLNLLPPEDAEAGADAFFASLDAEQAGMISRYSLRHTDGRLIEFEAVLNFRRNRYGVLTGVSGLQSVAVDAKDREEERIPEPVARAIREALDTAAECIVITDRDGAIIHANVRFAHLVGKQPEELTGLALANKISLVDRITGDPVPDIVNRILEGAPSLVLDHSHAITAADGPEDVVITCTPMVGECNRIDGALFLLRKPLEMPLSPAELVASNRMEGLGRMAAGIAHDFNNLLTTVSGGISLGVQNKDWSPINTAERACNTAKTLARQLLTFARGSTAGREVTDIGPIIRDTARMTGAGSKTQIEIDVAEGLHQIELDSAQMVQVFTNLVLNAMQVMTEPGRITIRASNLPLAQINSVQLPPGDYVRIEVQDTGPGISAENLARIFQPFFTTRKNGTGLGLSMARSIIAQHDGAIDAVSAVGVGTTFTIYLPRSYKEPVSEKQISPSMSHGSGSVLVMDDDSDLCMIATGILGMLGYEADSAKDGEEALNKYKRTKEIGRPYSAVILDLTIPGSMGGEEVLNELKKLDPNVCAIVSSGYATEEQSAHFRELGFSGVLAKPYRSADLGRVLKEVLAERVPPAGR